MKRHLPFLTALAVLSFAHPVLAQDFYVRGNYYVASDELGISFDRIEVQSTHA